MNKKEISNFTRYLFSIIAVILGVTFTVISFSFMSGYRSYEDLARVTTLFLILLYGFTLYRSFIALNQARVGLAYFLTIGGFLLLSFLQMVNCANATSFSMH